MSLEPAAGDRVLVVDDSPESLAMLSDALEEAGMTVLVAVDGPGALQRVQHAAPDIILLDAVMPGMDGFETCARLKQEPAAAGVPVIFMTGLTDTEHVVRGFEAGGVDYVTKPIVPEQLIARIRAHLANARLVSSAHDAIDLAGRALFSLDARGRVNWQTPEAARILQQNAMIVLGLERLTALLSEVRDEDGMRQRRTVPLDAGVPGRSVSFTPIGRTRTNELMVAVEVSTADAHEQRLRERFGLTARESDVLLWIARGKSNRDIGEILGLSPRTVNKHLERIYVKLGVENRAAAAALATGALSDR